MTLLACFMQRLAMVSVALLWSLWRCLKALPADGNTGYELVPRLVTVSHAAELVDCSPDLIYDLIRHYRVEARVLPGIRVRPV